MPTNQIIRSRVTVLIGIGLSLMILITVLRYRWLDRTQTVRMLDGRALTLRHVGYGTNQVFTVPGWSRGLSFLPAELRSLAGVKTHGLRADEPGLLLGVWQEGQEPGLHFVIADADGFETAELLQANPLEHPSDTPRDVLAFSFPRRSSSFWLRAYSISQSSFTNLVAEIPVKPPVITNHPSWTPEPMPVAKTDGDFTATLDSLRIHVETLPITGSHSRVLRGRAEASWKDRQRGLVRADWTVSRLLLWDATGNRSYVSERIAGRGWRQIAPDDGGLSLEFPWPLWPGETAYRIQAEFEPLAGAAFAPEEEWMVRGLSLPLIDGITQINQQTNLLGHPIHMLALVGERATLPGREKDVYDQVTLEIDAGSLPSHVRVGGVCLIDEQGRRLTPVMAQSNESFGFRPSPGTKTVDIRVCLYRPRRVEFTVAPKWVPAPPK